MANVSSFSGAMPVIPGGTVELGYSQITSSVSPSTTGYPAATDVIPAMTVVCDGGPVLVEFWCCYAKPANTADQSLTFTLFVDGAENQRYWGYLQTPASANSYKPVHLMCRLSPSAGSHTFAVKATVSSGTGTIGAGAGGGAVESPAFLRVSKIVNQNDGLKPFWTPPVVTSLPSQATEGDQVLRQMSSTGQLAPYQYVNGSWRCTAGGLVLVQRKTFSSVTSVSFDNCFTSDFGNYRIVASNLTGASSNTSYFRLRANGSDSSANSYAYAGWYVTYANASGSYTANTTTQAILGHVYNGGPTCSWTLEIKAPQRASVRTTWEALIANFDATSHTSGQFTGTTQFDGFTYYTTPNIAGEIAVYGYTES